MNSRKIIPILSVLLVLFVSPAFAAQAYLTWSAGTGNITGYRVYYGTSPGSHTSFVEAGNTTSYTVTNLADGVIYYFVIRAYNSYGESADSNEMSTLSPPSGLRIVPAQ